MRFLVLAFTHAGALAIGFALGIYLLPILIEPDSPAVEEIRSAVSGAEFTATFRRDLEDSDALHWGEGTLFISPRTIAFEGELAPGPDYRLYLSPAFVETEAAFEALKADMVQVGSVRTFENFTVSVPAGVDPSAYKAAIVWCETFSQFITAGAYQD